VLPRREVPDDCAQVFILTLSPEGFRILGEDFERQIGYTIYHVDIARPEQTDD
jgi:hypothetical protein